jgi:response regulator RpfG family c-di-GMP phosphodiesterase
MSYPSFSQVLNLLGALLRCKADWLAEESQYLSRVLVYYCKQIDVEVHNARLLALTAYLKNLGALQIPDAILSNGDPSIAETTHVRTWHLEAEKIARAFGVEVSAKVLSTYYHRSIPQDMLTKVFQVCNAWAACRYAKGYRTGMSLHDARVTLQQRAAMGWSDPAVVEHFLAHFPDCRE